MHTDTNAPLITQEDVATLLSTLPAPYTTLRVGDTIFPGCLMGDPSTQKWSLVASQYWHTRVEGAYIHFAAPACPQGFLVGHGDVLVSEASLIWRESAQYWAPVPPLWHGLQLIDFWHVLPSSISKHHRKTPAMMYLLACDGIICNPLEDSWRTRPIPEQHRELRLDDIVRKGDRRICAETAEWTIIPTTIYGTRVTADTTATARFARPIPSVWHNWYVDGRAGRGNDKKNDGTRVSKPCATVNALIKRLGEQTSQTGIPMYGSIWDVRGIFVTALDVPLDAPPERQLGVQNAMVPGMPNSIPWILQHMQLAGKSMCQSALLNLANESKPGMHRELSAAEVCQEHDLVFGLSPGDRLPAMWQPAPPRLWHQPGARHYIFCRHLEAPTLLESPEIRLLHHADKIAKLEKVANALIEQVETLKEILLKQGPG